MLEKSGDCQFIKMLICCSKGESNSVQWPKEIFGQMLGKNMACESFDNNIDDYNGACRLQSI